jgi:hypothetical protein
MSILLKDQIIKEVVYNAPSFGSNYYKSSHDSHVVHSSGLKSGKEMFYDFYAIDQLWRTVGSGKYSKSQRDLQKNLSDTDPLKNYHNINKPGGKPGETFSVGGDIVPEAMVNTIDKVHDEVVRSLAKSLISYVHLAVVQEFQYLVDHCNGWVTFRQKLVSQYNKNNKVTKDNFQEYINKYLPEMKSHPGVVKKLLKYSKYFSEMHTDTDQDVYDVSIRAASKVQPEKEPEVTDYPSNDDLPEPEPHKMPDTGEPDTTDYNAEPVDDPFHDTDEPTFTPSSEDPSYSGEKDYWKKKKTDENLLKEEQINISKVRNVYDAMNKSGVTLNDIALAYNNIEWDGSYGGSKWGEATVTLIKLMDAKKNKDTDEYIDIIDHIYDLQHNTGSLLNKGPMHVNDDDLNRRYRITHPARYLPFVSPLIKQLLTRYLKYFQNTDPELELNKDAIIKSPTKGFSPEEADYLVSIGFQNNGTNFMAPIRFAKVRANKKVENINLNYTIQKQQDDRISIFDDYKSDVQVFNTWDEAKQYIDLRIKPDIKKGSFGGAGAFGAASTPPPVKTDKQKAIESGTRIKLQKDAEEYLFDKCKMVWRPSSRYYKAYFAGSKRFYLYAFSAGTFLTTFNDSNGFEVFSFLNNALEDCYAKTSTAIPNPKAEEGKSYIGLPLGNTPNASSVPPVSNTASPTPNVLPFGAFMKGNPPIGMTATQSSLLANSPSKASYSAHVGINTPPKHTIRLTVADENMIKDIGFIPKMVGKDVWYIHQKTNDSVKFYPNNIAKAILVDKSTITPQITLPIDQMLPWLHKNFDASTTKSPTNTPATTTTNVMSGGKKAGSIFEKWITNAGFKWDSIGNVYSDGDYIINISPYPASIIRRISDGFILAQFNNLPSLGNWLKNIFPSQKQTDKSHEKSVQEQESITPEENFDIAQLVASYSPYYTQYVPGSTEDPDQKGFVDVYKNNNGKGELVYSIGKHLNYYEINGDSSFPLTATSFDELLKRLNQLLINLKSLLTTPSNTTEGITPEENSQIAKTVALYSSYYWSKYVPATKYQSAYVDIFSTSKSKGMGALAFSVGKLGNYFQINGNVNLPLKNVDNLPSLLQELEHLLKNYGQGGEPLTPNIPQPTTPGG